MKKQNNDKPAYLLNQSELCAALQISRQGFKKWGVEPYSKNGREVLFHLADVVENRLNHQYEKLIQNSDVNLAEMEKLRTEKLREEVNQLKLRNSVLEGKCLPAEGVTLVLTKILSASMVILDSLPLSIARKFPDLDSRIIDLISEAVIVHQNEVANLGNYIEEVIDDVQSDAEEKIR